MGLMDPSGTKPALPLSPDSRADAQARALAASIDAAAEELERLGPVAPEQLRRMLEELFAAMKRENAPG